MKHIPLTPQTEALSRRLIWFEEPECALRQTKRFLAYAFARATHEDMEIIRQFLDDDDLKQCLEQSPPGIIDPASWNYWNLKLGNCPVPDMPERILNLGCEGSGYGFVASGYV